jgi:hypothetical protein
MRLSLPVDPKAVLESGLAIQAGALHALAIFRFRMRLPLQLDQMPVLESDLAVTRPLGASL